MIIEVKKLSKKYKEQTAVHPLTFSINKGSCVAVLGPNGAGKTTTLQMLAGLLTPTSGRINFSHLSKGDMRSEIGFLPQHPSFFNWMTASEFLQLSGQLAHIRKNELHAKIDEVLNFVGLTSAKKKKIAGFSGGMRQRLGLAQAIIHEPKLLILDEPVSALDPQGRRDVLQLIQSLKGKMTILFSTHILHDAEQVCDDIFILKEGQLKWQGKLDDLQEEQHSINLKLTVERNVAQHLDHLSTINDYRIVDDTTAFIHIQHQTEGTQILSALLKNGAVVTHYELVKESLEDAYLKVMEL
ncbi:ABC transporter ATP-binding protein [Halalkalibacter sp. APA_J-10(15)]|uniref:ABC transporter ATP-binding protein n=1 Tax=unclassified Halalkalibacter TaxID=2893063 RepID=UPI001FF283F2|nr:ABC transporter ATP-binding protein [Halalkalibacter sp. APA_J-10(15)]MCK0473060.1 ABC transporter ATP-binding protein [Halalkalibacter sp. APA_J-10(15)]